MKEQLNLWLSGHARLPGVVGCAILYPDRTAFVQPWVPDIQPEALEKSVAGASDLWRLLRVNGISGASLRWDHSERTYHSAQRSDGHVMMIITTHKAPDLDPDEIKSLIHSFRNWRLPS